MAGLDTSRNGRFENLRRSTISELSIDLTLDCLDSFDLDEYEGDFEVIVDGNGDENYFDNGDLEHPILTLTRDELEDIQNSSSRWSTTDKQDANDSPVLAQRKPSVTLRWVDPSKYSDESPRVACRRVSAETVMKRKSAIRPIDESPKAAIRRVSIEQLRKSQQAAKNKNKMNCRKPMRSTDDMESAAAVATASVKGRWGKLRNAVRSSAKKDRWS